jgi:E3 ubiquitin-protein ligase HUWE1
MSSSDLDILLLALNLLLRPAQQYSAQPHVSQALSISTPQLVALSKRWPHSRDHNVNLVDLITDQGVQQIGGLPPEAREVNFTFYRKEKDGKTSFPGANVGESKDPLASTPPAPPQTPAQKPSAGSSTVSAPLLASGSGAVLVHIDADVLGSKDAMEVLKDTVDSHSIPDEEKYELLCRIRAAQSFIPSPSTLSTRQKLLTVRLLAIAIFCHTHSETQAQASLLLYEPDLIAHIAELLQLDKGIPIPVQSAAIAALDALGRYRNKIQEVLAAVNAGVNHGILMTLLRRTVVSVADSQSSLPHSYVEGLLSFVTYLASHTVGGNMVVGAGLVPLLIQLVDNKLPNRLAIVSKTVQLMDNVLYGFPNAFQLFVNSQGVDTLVGRIEVCWTC